jgi:hypothetical protein
MERFRLNVQRFKLSRKSLVVLISAVLALTLIMPALAASTTKKLSSNFTLVNLGDGPASGNIEFKRPDGSAWKAAEPFTISTPGGQLIRRQYDADSGLAPGRGSVVISANAALGAVVQLQARDGQVPTTGAYSGISAPSSSVYVPLVIRRGASASGMANSQIIAQNTGSSPIQIDIDLIATNGSKTYTKSFPNVAAGASVEYDLDVENNANVPEGWVGSAVVKSAANGGQVGVVSNFFLGEHAMQTFNGFSTPAQKWFAPLVTSRLGNGLSTPIAVQNLSGGTIPVGGIKIACKTGAGSPGGDFNLQNTAVVGNTASVFFNPVLGITPGFPDGWYGSCTIDTQDYNTVAFVQMRFVGTDKAAAYEAIPATGTNKTAVIPLVAKRLGNGFASAVTIQNLSSSAATVTLKYIASTDCAGCQNVTLSNQSIPANGSLIQNHRIESGANSVPQLPDGWFGSLVVESNQAVDSFIQLDFLTATTGDPFMAHNGFTK